MSTSVSITLITIVTLQAHPLPISPPRSHAQLMLEVHHYTKPLVMTLLIGPICWFLLFWLLYTYSWHPLYVSSQLGAYVAIMNSPFHWFTSILTVGIAVMPFFLWTFVQTRFWPTPSHVRMHVNQGKH